MMTSTVVRFKDRGCLFYAGKISFPRKVDKYGSILIFVKCHQLFFNCFSSAKPNLSLPGLANLCVL